jgi:transcriptional regulator with XRE-family HTH domain
MDIAKTLVQIRKKKGLSQEAASKKLKMPQSHLSKIETGAKKPTMATLNKIAKGYDIPVPIMLFQSMTIKDVQPGKRSAFKTLKPIMDKIIKKHF